MAVLNQRVDSWLGVGICHLVIIFIIIFPKRTGMTRRSGVILQKKPEACFFSRAFSHFILSRRMSGPMLVGFLALSQLNLTLILRNRYCYILILQTRKLRLQEGKSLAYRYMAELGFETR